MSRDGDHDVPVRYQRPTLDGHYLDQALISRLERNDPSVDCLNISHRNIGVVRGVGRVIGGNTMLRHLSIDIISHSSDKRIHCWYDELFRGLACNRSIESFTLHGPAWDWDIFHILTPFLEHNCNLRYMELGWLHTSLVQSFASILSKSNKTCQQVQYFSLQDNSSSDESIATLLNSLRNLPNLIELYLGINCLEQMGCIALANLLNSHRSKVRFLDIEDKISNECAIILSNVLATNNKLTEFSLSLNELTTESWRTVFKVFSYPTCSLERLCLHSNLFKDDDITSLGDALADNRTLKYLDLGFNTLLTSAGWRGFSKCLRNRNSALEELDLSLCGIDDDGAAAIVNALVGNLTLTKLGLEDIPQISSAGWKFIFIVLLNNVLSLEDLLTTHERGGTYSSDNDWIDWMENMDWTIISRALCDHSSINATYSSNHAFHTIRGNKGKTLDGLLPDEILFLLIMNRNENNKTEVARQKILKSHFHERNTNIQELTCMPLMIMPFAIEWIGRCSRGFSLMYNFVRQLPSLFVVHQGPLAKKQKCMS